MVSVSYLIYLVRVLGEYCQFSRIFSCHFTMNESAIIFSNCIVPVQPVADPLSF